MEATAQPLLSDELLNECKTLGRAVLGNEHRDTPFYFENAPAEYPSDMGCAAFTFLKRVDVMLFDQIVAREGWRGPGITIVFCGQFARDEALGITLHELAHGPEIADAPLAESSPEVKALQRSHLSDLTSRPRGDVATMPRWYENHGFAFTRACLHLHYRAWSSGFEVGLPEILFAGAGYDLSPAWRYMHALGDEPQRMLGATLAEIEAADAPPNFCQLWKDDFLEWCKRTRLEQVNRLGAA